MKYIKKFNNLSDYETFKGGEDWITPNVSSIVENTSAKFEPVQIPVTFYIGDYSYTAPYSMTWKQAIDNPELIISHNNDEYYGNDFIADPGANCNIDTTLYYNENTNEIMETYCIDCFHVGLGNCLGTENIYLCDENGNKIMSNQKIKPMNYSFIL